MAKKSSLLKKSGARDLFRPKMLVVYAVAVFVAFWLTNSFAAEEATNSLLSAASAQLTSDIPGVRKTVALYDQNGSGETGKAVLLGTKNQTKVTITVSNEPTGARQPAHIHGGSCPKPGAVLYPLNDVVTGTSTTVLNIKLSDLSKMAPLTVNVHKSAAQTNIYVSCGNLK